MKQNNLTYPLSNFESAQLIVDTLNECDIKVDIGDGFFDFLFENPKSVDEKEYRYIYLIQNLINGSVYVGQHSTNNLNDGYFGSGKILKLAIKKHSKENFKLSYLEFCQNKDILNKREAYWIDFFRKDSKKRGFGIYNIADGGYNWLTEDIVKKIIETKRAKYESGEIIPWNKGKTGIYSEETLRKFSESATGRKQSQETKEKKRIAMVGKKRSTSSINKMIKTKKENPKVFTAEERNIIAKNQISYNKENMKQCIYCKKLCNPINLKTHHNENCRQNPNVKTIVCPYCKAEGIRMSQMKRYHFDNCIHNPKNKNNKEILLKSRSNKGVSRKIYQIDVMSGKIIKTWDSITEARLVHKKGNISRACQTNTKAGGYFWKYVNKNKNE